jgi:hypothetical protein
MGFFQMGGDGAPSQAYPAFIPSIINTGLYLIYQLAFGGALMIPACISNFHLYGVLSNRRENR